MVPVGVPNVEDFTVSLRLHVTPEGVVKQIEMLEAKERSGLSHHWPRVRAVQFWSRRDELGRLADPGRTNTVRPSSCAGR